MKKIREILKKLPEEKPKMAVDNIVARIVKREIERWREKRYSWVLLGILGILGVLGMLKIVESAGILGSGDYWELVKEDRFLLDWQSFLEGNPTIEGIFLVFISLIIIVPIWVIRHKDKEIGR